MPATSLPSLNSFFCLLLITWTVQVYGTLLEVGQQSQWLSWLPRQQTQERCIWKHQGRRHMLPCPITTEQTGERFSTSLRLSRFLHFKARCKHCVQWRTQRLPTAINIIVQKRTQGTHNDAQTGHLTPSSRQHKQEGALTSLHSVLQCEPHTQNRTESYLHPRLDCLTTILQSVRDFHELVTSQYTPKVYMSS